MKIEINEKIEKMRNGEKIKCPRCEKGYISAIGEPKKTKTFGCDSCPIGITLTVPYKMKEE